MTQRRFSARLSRFAFSITLLAILIGSGAYFDHTAGRQSGRAAAMALLDRDLAREGWSAEVRQTAAWVISTGDNRGLPFVVIDQVRQRLFAFGDDGRLVGSTPILSSGRWREEAAPAGRFVADRWHSTYADAIVWANRDQALSLRAAPATASERRLAAEQVKDRARAGSFHVAGEFYRQHLSAFRHHASVAYVLPDMLPVRRNFIVYASSSTSARAARSRGPQPGSHS